MYVWQQVKALQAQGLKVKQIARKLKVSKNTVKKYLKSSGPPEFHSRGYEKKVDPYREQVKGMLKKGYIGTRIYEELALSGFDGSLSAVHRHIRSVEHDKEITSLSTTRVETDPGVQMQYDWKEWALPVNGKSLRIYIHEVVLSYSRKKYYTWSLTITTTDVIRAIHDALLFFGGIPLEVVIDNPKQMVITHERDGVVLYNDAFLKFLGFMGMDPNPCHTYRARTKGKAERPFYYLQEHLLKGLQLTDLSQFDAHLAEFMDRYNARPHSALHESPDTRFIRERDTLRSIPFVEPTCLYPRETRKVSNDGYLSFGGGFYPVPMALCLHTVFVESVFGTSIRVYDTKGDLAIAHPVHLCETGLRPVHPEHEEMNRSFLDKKEAKRSAIVITFTDTFPEYGNKYLAGIKEAIGPNLYWHLKEIMTYTELYPREDVSATLAECIALGAYHKNTVKRLLGIKTVGKPVLPLASPVAVHPCALARDLSVYREVTHE